MPIKSFTPIKIFGIHELWNFSNYYSNKTSHTPKEDKCLPIETDWVGRGGGGGGGEMEDTGGVKCILMKRWVL